MRERFIELWKRIGAQGNPALEFANLQSVYSQPQRFYHNLTHISNCLVDLDSAKHLTNQPDLVELAIWYHDAVYDTQAEDNEEKSAQLAYDVCLTAKLPEELTKGAMALILATKHVEVSSGIDERVMMDVDLSILGKPQEEFDTYERNMRMEYKELIQKLSEKEFKVGRLGVLLNFLQRAENHRLYLTDFFRQKYEAQARKNLLRSIDALR